MVNPCGETALDGAAECVSTLPEVNNESSRDALGDRMKKWEKESNLVLPPRLPLIIRVDGKSFHTWTRGIYKPDVEMARCMTETAVELVKNISGAKLAYTQSDEISVLVTEDRPETQAWFGKKLQKIVSVAASLATAYFAEALKRHQTLLLNRKSVALFDARAFVLPEHEVPHYFNWRQIDAVRNSVQLEAHRWWSQKQIHGLSARQLVEKLKRHRNIDWSELPPWQKHGSCVVRVKTAGTYIDSNDPIKPPVPFLRGVIKEDWLIPNFSKNPEYITRFMIAEESCENTEATTIEEERDRKTP